jgi:hypothetical protein
MNTLEENIDDLFIQDEEAYELELYRQIRLAETEEEDEYDYIYKIEWYDINKKPINYLYYYKASDTRWIFDSNTDFNVYYIKVSKSSKEYHSAFYNSKILDDFTSSKIIKKKVKNSKII